MTRPICLLSPLSVILVACSTPPTRVPVMMPAPVNLVQYDLVAVDHFEGEGCAPFSDQLAGSLAAAVNPLTGQPAFEVLHRRDIDRTLDQVRDRRGEWDSHTMAMLDRWRKAEIVLKGVMQRHGVDQRVIEERLQDQQGNVLVRQRQVFTAVVEVQLEATDVAGNRTFDAVTLRGSSSSQRYLGHDTPREFDASPLLVAARAQVVQQYLERVLPHQQWLAVELYADRSFPDLQIGNGYAETGNWQAAAEAYRRALDAMTGEQAKHRYKGLFNLGVAYEFSDRFDAAREALEEAYALGQDRKILAELRRVAAREDEVQRLRAQSAARPAR